METERGTTQEFNRFPFARDLHEIQPVFPEADFGLGITSGLPVIQPQSQKYQGGHLRFAERHRSSELTRSHFAFVMVRTEEGSPGPPSRPIWLDGCPEDARRRTDSSISPFRTSNS